MHIKENKEMIHDPALVVITIYFLSYHEIGEQLCIFWGGASQKFMAREGSGKEKKKNTERRDWLA